MRKTIASLLCIGISATCYAGNSNELQGCWVSKDRVVFLKNGETTTPFFSCKRFYSSDRVVSVCVGSDGSSSPLVSNYVITEGSNGNWGTYISQVIGEKGELTKITRTDDYRVSGTLLKTIRSMDDPNNNTLKIESTFTRSTPSNCKGMQYGTYP